MPKVPESAAMSPVPGGDGPDANLPRQARYDAQLVLGQYHGVMHAAVSEAPGWIPADQLQPLRAAYADVASTFGAAQAALNSGAYDAKLAAAGLSGPQVEPKKGGFHQALARWRQGTKQSVAQMIRKLKPVLRWGRPFVGSLATVVPGVEAIGEFADLLQNSIEDWEEADPSDTQEPS